MTNSFLHALVIITDLYKFVNELSCDHLSLDVADDYCDNIRGSVNTNHICYSMLQSNTPTDVGEDVLAANQCSLGVQMSVKGDKKLSQINKYYGPVRQTAMCV